MQKQFSYFLYTKSITHVFRKCIASFLLVQIFLKNDVKTHYDFTFSNYCFYTYLIFIVIFLTILFVHIRVETYNNFVLDQFLIGLESKYTQWRVKWFSPSMFPFLVTFTIMHKWDLETNHRKGYAKLVAWEMV